MRRRPLLVLTSIATVLVAPAAASAVVVTPDATGTFEVAVAPDAGGGALLAWIAATSRGQALRIRERAADGRYGPVQELLHARVLVTPSVAVGADGSALVLVGGSAGNAAFPSEIVALRRAGRDQPFASPEVVARADGYASVLSAAANPAGDVVAVTQANREGTVVSTHTGLAPATLTALGPVGTAGAAIGNGGRVVVATYADGQRDVLVRSWQTGSPVGEARILTRLRSRPDLHAAVDAQGTATVAFARDLPGNAIGVVAARSRVGQPFASPVVLDHGPNAQIADVAAGGTKTAVAWSALTSPREPVRVAFARGAEGFDGVQAPGTPTLRLRGTAGRVPSSANRPRVAVSPAGDVALAYGYGPFQAVHTTLRRAGAARFGAPRVLTALGRGGLPTPVFLSGRTAFVATADGTAITAATASTGRKLLLRPPGLSTTPLSVRELRSHGTVTTRVRCSTPCVVQVSARITTGIARSPGPSGQRISRQGRRAVVLTPAGAVLPVTFTLPAAGREAFARTGRASAKVIVTVADVYGAARSSRETFDVGRR